MFSYLEGCEGVFGGFDDGVHCMCHRECMSPVMVWYASVILTYRQRELKQRVHVKPENVKTFTSNI